MKLSEAKKLSAQVIRAEIEGTAMSHDGRKDFVIYIVKCTTRDGHGWECRKRFSEFVKLKAEMELSGCPGVEEVKLPPKRVLRANGARVVEERVAGLQHFLAKAIAMYVDHGVLIQFLARPPDGDARAPPGWRLKESRERLEQLREMVSDLRAKGGESDPLYQAMLTKLQQESRAFKAGQSTVASSDDGASSAQGGRRTLAGATGARGSVRTPMRQTVGAISEHEREKQIQLQHGVMSHDRGRELQKELQEQKQRATLARSPKGAGGRSRRSSVGVGSGGPCAHLYNSGTFGKTYAIGRLLGEGTFGRVYQCTHNQSNRQVAVKMVPTNQKHFKESDLLEETRLQQLCAGHPNIVQIFDLFKERKAV